MISNTGSNGQPILTPAQLPMIHKAIMEACDAVDGVRDGILQAPLNCQWKPQSIICKGGATDNCLTASQAEVVQKIYDGARNSKGELLYWGMPRGSEDQWAGWLRPRTSQGQSITGYMAFYPSASPSYAVQDFNYDTDPARVNLTAWMHNPLNPDLSAFKKSGGKLILFHGYNDNNIPTQASITYYESAVRTMGGRAATDAFFRLFTPPAVNHCRGGDGGGSIDWIGAMEAWIEKGQAPDVLMAYHPAKPYPTIPREITDYGGGYSRFDRFPLQPGEYDRVRPLFPYPAIAKYTKGDPNLATSYVKAMP